jgi:hypothetical protein
MKGGLAECAEDRDRRSGFKLTAVVANRSRIMNKMALMAVV